VHACARGGRGGGYASISFTSYIIGVSS